MNRTTRSASSLLAAFVALTSAAFAGTAGAAHDNALGAAATANAAPPTANAQNGDPGAALRSRVDLARNVLLAHYRDVDKRSGLADTLAARLDADESYLFIASKPENAPASDFWSWNAAIVALDESLIDQYETGKYHPLAAVRGLDEIPIAMGADRSPQPCAIAVPPSYSPDKAAPLVVLLHGLGISEAAELAEPLFRGLAAETNTIVIAPFAHGDDIRSPAAAPDVYAALDAAQSAFNIDKRRVYLVGDSLGGYATFDVAPLRPAAWSALFAIRSTMDPADQRTVRDQLRGKALYVVSGAADGIARADDVRRSVAWFRSVGLAVSYYEVPGAGHDLVALGSSVQRAWREMHAGVRSLQPPPPLDVPQVSPPPSQKP